MDIVISHMAALRLMRSRRFPVYGGASCSVELPSRMPTAADVGVARCLLYELNDLEGPIGVLLPRKSVTYAFEPAVAHVWSTPLPKGALVQVAPGVRIVSPLFLPVLMAPELTPLELQLLLAELLGLYAVSDSFETGLLQRSAPLATRDQMGAFLDALGPVRWSGLVRKALAAAPVQAASPQEAKLFLRSTLPFSRGGYQMGDVALNDALEIRQITSRSKDLQVRKPDLLFLNGNCGACLDYMGAWHATDLNVQRDTARRNELLAAGFKPYEIYKKQYDDLDYMDALMTRIRSDLGLYIPHPARACAARRRRARYELWRELEAIDLRGWEARPDLR